MAIIKKKDIKNYKKKEELDELVDADGSPIEGDFNAVNDTEIQTAPQQTTDDFAASAMQPNRSLSGYGEVGVRRLRAEAQMKKVVESILENGMSDINSNQVPDLQELSDNYQKPIVANKTQEMVSTISKNNLSGDEIAIVLSYMLDNINVQSIPQQYRVILKSKL